MEKDQKKITVKSLPGEGERKKDLEKNTHILFLFNNNEMR